MIVVPNVDELIGAGASGFRPLPIVDFSDVDTGDNEYPLPCLTCDSYGNWLRVDDRTKDEYLAVHVTPLPVDDPSTVVGQFALWAERIEPL